MSDIADIANDRAESERAALLAGRPVFELDAGVPGECDICGEWSGRLIEGACAPCRDKYYKLNLKRQK